MRWTGTTSRGWMTLAAGFSGAATGNGPPRGTFAHCRRPGRPTGPAMLLLPGLQGRAPYLHYPGK
jgi:hypothetical protein